MKQLSVCGPRGRWAPVKPSLGLLVLIGFGAQVSGCAQALSPDAAAPRAEVGEPAPVETPAVDDSPPPAKAADSERAFTTAVAPPEDECAAGSVHVEGPGEERHACVPVVAQEALGDESNWDHLIVIEAPRVALYDRKQSCKSIPCEYSGAMLPLEGERFIPLEARKGDVWNTNGGIYCGRHDRPPSFGCPQSQPASLLGIVHAHRVAGQSAVLLTFELRAASQEGGDRSAPASTGRFSIDPKLIESPEDGGHIRPTT